MSSKQRSGGKPFSRRDLLRGALAAGAGWAPIVARRQAAAGDSSEAGFIDAHVHVWPADTSRYALKPGVRGEQRVLPSFTPEELFAHCRPCGVRRIVLIQMSYYGFDNSYMLDMMRKHAGVFSGVAVIDEHDRPRETMQKLRGQGARGFRISPGKAPPERWLEDDAMAAMWACASDSGLALCPLVNPEYLPAIDRMCRRFPQAPVVIDHFARIGMDGQIRTADLDNLCGLARHKRVCVKVSAFYALGQKKSPYLDLGPMIRRVLDAFGPERLMWGSDAPFQVLPPHRYADSVELIRSRLDFLTPSDRQWLLCKTAQRVFFN